jgi:hypothetical protein
MTLYEAALQVLRSVKRPLTAQQITNYAMERGLIAPVGKTPYASMSAMLYVRARTDPELVKIADPGNHRARRGTVRWTLRGVSSAESK